MRFRILGPLQIIAVEGGPVRLAPRLRRLLAALLLSANRVVPRARLYEVLWDGEPPATAEQQFKNLVWRLRQVLVTAGGIGEVVCENGGYRLRVGEQQIDAQHFAEYVVEARTLQDAGRFTDAALKLRDGLALWRDSALHDCGQAIQNAARHLDDARVTAYETCLELELRLGRHDQMVDELAQLTDPYPLSERLAGLYMLALVRSGRQPLALRVYESLRRQLADELGCDPSRQTRELHVALLREDPDLMDPSWSPYRVSGFTPHGQHQAGDSAAGAEPPPLTCTLPADTAAFAGRDELLQKITAQVQQDARTGWVAAVHTVSGMPGIGKTAFAIHVGHVLKHLFPDRRLFLDLYAHTVHREPMDPREALALLLTADGVDVRYLPDDLNARAAMWRDRMADKRILLILDNAVDSDQVGPLLPGATQALVIVTSRRYLGDLPQASVAVPLDVLPPDEAAQLFVRLAPRASDAPPVSVHDVVALCGHLPLAISILAGLYAKHPSWSMDNLLQEARHRRVDAAVERLSVADAFGLSYRDLTVDEQQLFRYLGLHPGVEFSPYDAAALTGRSADEASRLLDLLYSAGLLVESGFRRFRMHDLIRDYAVALTRDDPAEQRERAVGRLLDYHQFGAQAADRHVARQTRVTAAPAIPGRPETPDLSEQMRARAWMRDELPNILACIADAERRNMAVRAIDLAAAIAGHLRIYGPWDQAIALYANAATSARLIGEPAREAEALLHAGTMRRLTGDYPHAAATLQHAFDLYHDLDSRQGQANALLELAVVWRQTHDLPSAVTAAQQALEHCQHLGDRLGQANAHYELSVLQAMMGDFASAATTARLAQELYRDLDDQYGYANALNVVGAIARERGDLRTASASLAEALSRYRAIDDRRGQANALLELGMVRRRTGELLDAAGMLQQSSSLFAELGSRHGQANATLEHAIVLRQTGDLTAAATFLANAARVYQDLGSRNADAHLLLERGILHRLTGKLHEATTTLGQALNLSHASGHRQGQAEILQELGVVRGLTGDADGGIALLVQALSLFREVGYRLGEAQAQNHTGVLKLTLGDAHQVRPHHYDALQLAREITSPLEEARALEGIGRCALALGDPDTFASHLRQALEIYQRVGSADAARVAEELEQRGTPLDGSTTGAGVRLRPEPGTAR